MRSTFMSVVVALVLCVGLGLHAQVSRSRSGSHNMSPPAQKILSANGGAMTCRLILKSMAPPPATEDWWGFLSPSSKRKVSYIAGMDVRIHQKPISLPVSAYSGIAEPNTLEIQVTKGSFTIHILGGDAASSYSLRLLFKHHSDGYFLSRRTVIHGEMTNSNEKTDYHNALE